ncbi:hypothetical protein JTS99_12050 [Clostridium botulinum]|nr:hypothetical protein [Clostridium botulinum]
MLNAASFEKSGYSLVLKEEELEDKTLIKKLNYLYENRNVYINNMSKSKMDNGVKNITELIKNIQNKYMVLKLKLN